MDDATVEADGDSNDGDNNDGDDRDADTEVETFSVEWSRAIGGLLGDTTRARIVLLVAVEKRREDMGTVVGKVASVPARAGQNKRKALLHRDVGDVVNERLDPNREAAVPRAMVI